jgi:hypothetical protein
MSDESDKKLFWTTLPGILTTIAALIVALTGAYSVFLIVLIKFSLDQMEMYQGKIQL